MPNKLYIETEKNVSEFGRLFNKPGPSDIPVPQPGPSPVPSEPPSKGDIVLFGGHRYRVLKANGWDIEVMCLDIVWQRYEESPSDPEHQATFQTADGEATGVKYAGSDLDVYLNETWYASLPEDVQEAIIEQEGLVQDMYNLDAEEGTEDFLITGGTFGITYRIKKVSITGVEIGNRKVYELGIQDFIEYFGNQTTNDSINEFYFEVDESNTILSSWLNSAKAGDTTYACCVSAYFGGVGSIFALGGQLLRPVFHIDLEHIAWLY